MLDDSDKNATLEAILAVCDYSVYPNFGPDLLYTFAKGQTGFQGVAMRDIQREIEYCHYWLAANRGTQLGYPGASLLSPPSPPKLAEDSPPLPPEGLVVASPS